MKYSFYLLAVAAILGSCTKEVSVPIRELKPSLVVNSLTETNNTIAVSVSKTAGIYQYKQGQNLSVANAEVSLLASGTSEVLKYDAASGLYTGSAKAEVGKNYEIKVKVVGYNDVEASSIVPQVVLIEDIKKISRVRLNEDGRAQDELRIKFTDPPSPNDYYIVKYYPVNYFDEQGNAIASYDICINSPDVSLESIYNEEVNQNTCFFSSGIFFRDKLFNGNSKELRLFIESGFLLPAERDGQMIYPIIELYHVTEDFFKFSKSYEYAKMNAGNPFAEPTNVYSNVKNGYGSFSIVSKDAKEIK